MKQQRHAIKRLIAIFLIISALPLFTGCQPGDPVVNVGSPSPLVSNSEAPSETGTQETPAQTALDVPRTPEEPDPAEPTASIGSGAYTIAADTSESKKTYYSEEADENALRVENDAKASIDGATIEKRSGDASSLVDSLTNGLNAAVLVRAEADLLLLKSDIVSMPLGAGGAVASESSLSLEGGSVRTTGDSSIGIGAISGASISARETNLSTQGENSPAIRASTGGSVNIEGGVAVTGGEKSPVIEASSGVTAANATFRASKSAAAAVNAGGDVSLTDCALSGSMGHASGASTEAETYCVALYRGADATGDVSEFAMTRGALTALTGDLFYATNTTANIYLEEVALSLSEDRLLLLAAGNDGTLGWGKSGENGAVCTLTANNQTLAGDIVADELSTVKITLKGESDYTGTINTANTAHAAEMTLEDGSTWTLTGNAYLTAFSGRVSGINTNGFTVYVNGIALTE